MKAAFDEGVPAPEPMWIGDETDRQGESFFVRRVDGETLPRRLLRDDEYADARAAAAGAARRERWRRSIASIPAKHRLDGLPAPPTAYEPGARSRSTATSRSSAAIAPEPHPAFELAFRWLRRHPVDHASRRLSADARARRLPHRQRAVRAGGRCASMLDWELAHIGDPMEDMGFICVRSWRFGGAKPVGGIGEREEFFAAYEAAGGAQVDPERVRFWEVFGNLRWGIICISQAKHVPRRRDQQRRAGEHRPAHGGDRVGAAGADRCLRE